VVQKFWLPLALALVTGASLVPAYAADKPMIAVSAADLTGDIDVKLKDLEEKLKDADSFTKNKKKGIPQAAGTLAVVAQAIADSAEDSPAKKSAPDLRDAAISIAKAGSLDDAKKGLEAAKAAAGGKASGAKAEADWAKLIDMDSLMGEVNARSGSLRKASRKWENHDVVARDAAVLSVLAVAIEADTHDVKDKADIEKWKKYSKDLQTSMAGLVKTIKAKDLDKFKTEFQAASKSCNSCHTEIRDK
jgi:hypothetical protein